MQNKLVSTGGFVKRLRVFIIIIIMLLLSINVMASEKSHRKVAEKILRLNMSDQFTDLMINATKQIMNEQMEQILSMTENKLAVQLAYDKYFDK